MQRKYPHVLAMFYGTPWAILPEKLAEIEAALWRRIASGPLVLETPELTEAARARIRDDWAKLHAGTGRGEVLAWDDENGAGFTPSPNGPGYKLVGSAAVIQVYGTITPRPSVFSDFSGGASSEQLGRAVDAAAADPKAEAIVLDIDSPGGSVWGMPELTAKVLAARKAKPVHAVANHVAASAAYWIATQANTVAVTPAGWVGSVGCIWARMDDTKADEMAGLKTTYISAGEFKAEGHGAITDAELADKQAMVNAYYAQFVAGVAKGRGVSVAKVEKDFGQGRVKLPEAAIEARMADRIATLDQVVNEVNGVRTERTKRKVAADMARAGLPTA